MVLSRHALPNGGLHQPRQGREDVDGGVDLGGAKKVCQKAGSKLSLLSHLYLSSHPLWFSGDWSLFIPQRGRLVTPRPPLSPTNSRAWVYRCLHVRT